MKKYGRILCVLMTSLLVFSSIMVSAYGKIGVYLNGIPINFDVPPQIINNRTMVPLRAIFKAMGATVTWDEHTQTAFAKKDDITVEAIIGSNYMYVNGKEKRMDVTPVVINNRTLVPARFVAEAFECEVEWDEKNSAVYITSEYSERNPADDVDDKHNNYSEDAQEDYDGLPDEVINDQYE